MDFQLSLQSEETRSVYPESPLAVEPDTSVADVIRLLQTEKMGAALVCEGDRLAGIFTERDALRLMSGSADMSVPVSTTMSKDPVTIDSSAPVADAIKLMSEGGYRHLPSTIYNFPHNPQQAPAEREGA